MANSKLGLVTRSIRQVLSLCEIHLGSFQMVLVELLHVHVSSV